MSLRKEFARAISAVLLVAAAKITPKEDILTREALQIAAEAMVFDDRRRGVDLRAFRRS